MALKFSRNNEETKLCPIFWVELSNREEEHISWPKYFLDLSCSNNALYVHNAFPLQMFSASMGHFLRFLMYILIHSTSPRTLPSCLNTTLVHWNLFGFFNGWAMENKMYKVILLVFMNQGCAINLEHISILLELSPMDKQHIFHWSGVTSTKWIDLSER